MANNSVTVSPVTQSVTTTAASVTQSIVTDSVTVSPVTHSVIINGVRGVNNITCVTTEKMPIIDYVCVLPSKPTGNFIFNTANVYVPYGTAGELTMEIHEDIMLDVVNAAYVLRFTDTSHDYTGNFAVVSYLGVVA